MRFLVTGGAGFIGSNFIRNLLLDRLESKPTSIVALDSLTYAGKLENLKDVWQDSRLTFVKGDIRDRKLVNSLVENSDIIFNFAAESHVDRSIHDAQEFLATNVMGTAVIAQSCIDFGNKRLIQVSTDEVYGSIASGSWDENAILEPNSPYAASKAAAELMLRGIGKTHGLDYRITRSSNNYGPNQHLEKVIPYFISKLLKEEDLPIYGDGSNRREWVHVDDHCKGIELVALYGKTQEVYNIGGGFELTNLSLAELLMGLSGLSNSKIVFIQDRKNHDYRYSINDFKIRRQLGYAPQKEFVYELARVFDWYRKNQDQLDFNTKKLDVKKI